MHLEGQPQRKSKDGRWGKPFEDRRDWRAYNEQLVERGRFFIHTGFFQHWAEELKRANEGKEGARFEYPDGLFQFLACVRARTGVDYRSLEGWTQGLIELARPTLRKSLSSEDMAQIKPPDHATIQRRVVKASLDPATISLLRKGEEAIVALDASGVKVTNRGEWLRKHDGGRKSKGWIKVHIGVFGNKQTSAMTVTDERGADVTHGPGLVKASAGAAERKGARVTKALCDRAYAARPVFNAAAEAGAEPVVPVKKGSTAKAKNSPEWGKRVREFQALGYEEWARQKGYGWRWHVEGKFSSVKRMMGEEIRSRSWEGQVSEARWKFWTHDALLNFDQTGKAPWNP